MTTKKNSMPSFTLLTLVFCAAILFMQDRTSFAAEFDLIYSNDIRGEIEPCG